jgi:hypothetical protein
MESLINITEHDGKLTTGSTGKPAVPDSEVKSFAT